MEDEEAAAGDGAVEGEQAATGNEARQRGKEEDGEGSETTRTPPPGMDVEPTVAADWPWLSRNNNSPRRTASTEAGSPATTGSTPARAATSPNTRESAESLNAVDRYQASPSPNR